MALDPYRAGPLYQGGADLVGALMGGDQVEAAARAKIQSEAIRSQTAQATLDKKITDAFLARDKRKALQGAQAQYEAMGDDPMVAALKASAHIGGFGNIEQAQRFGLRDEAATALRGDPNFTPANAALAALNGKPVAGIDIDSGNIIRGQYGAAPTVTPTDETLGQIANRALTASAQARVSNVKADAGGWNPRTGGGAGEAGRKGTQIERARAIIDAVSADGSNAAVGHSPRSVAKRIAAGLDVRMDETPAGSIRWITADGVRNIPMGKPANGNAPVPIDVQESTAPEARKSIVEDGKRIVEVANPAAAKAAWPMLPKGAYLRFPNGTLKRKE